jgi:sugar/nucleoside kinase (ribokinase family)
VVFFAELAKVQFDCLSVGILVADHLCTPIARLPKAGELLLADNLPLAIGGCAANVAIDLRGVDARVGVIGCVGADIFGRFVCETLDAAGIETHGVRHIEGVSTSGTLILNVAGDDRRFIHTVGANAAFSAAEIPMRLVQQSKVLYVGGYLLMASLRASELADIFRQAHALGVVTVLDIVLPGPGDHLAELAPVLAHTDVFLPNTDEARAITGLDDPVAQAETFLALGAKAAVITCGHEGTVVLTDRMRLRAGVYPSEFVGATGAGDAFDAGYILGLVRGDDPRRCLEWGSALGASCVRSLSATAGVFGRAEAEAFIHTNRLEVREF